MSSPLYDHMVLRRLSTAGLVAVLALATLTVVWSGLNLVPIRFLWRYGLTPGCEPTGKVIPADGVEFVVIGPGCFRMGSTANGKPGTVVGRLCGPVGIDWGKAPESSDEMPAHWVEFRRGFAIAKTEVTNAQYRRYLEANPGAEKPQLWDDESYNQPREPVGGVGWDEAKAYCVWLAKESKLPVRLPSESEWEASCRGGTSSEYVSGEDDAGLGEFAWYDENSEGKAHAVATKSANAWGLYDLSGNVWEWCEDAWHDSYRLTRTTTGSRGETVTETVAVAPTDGAAWQEVGSPGRVIRGGSWFSPAVYCRSAFRIGFDPSVRYTILGFRPALTVPSDP